jgi:hypothetical protein
VGRTRGPGRSHGSGPVNGQAQNTVTQHAIATPSHHRVHAELFAAGRDDPRARRPSDAIRAVAYLVVLLVVAVLSVIGHDFDTRFPKALVGLPGFLHALWWIGVWGAVAWATALLVIMLVRGRPLLAGRLCLRRSWPSAVRHASRHSSARAPETCSRGSATSRVHRCSPRRSSP